MYQLFSLMEEKLRKLSYATFSYDSSENEVVGKLNIIETRRVDYHNGLFIYVNINDRFSSKKIENFIKHIESITESAKNLQDKLHYEKLFYVESEYRVNNRLLSNVTSKNKETARELYKIMNLYKKGNLCSSVIVL